MTRSASDRAGTLEPGKLADIVVVEGDPLVGIGQMQHIHSVIQGGELLVSDGRLVWPPSGGSEASRLPAPERQ